MKKFQAIAYQFSISPRKARFLKAFLTWFLAFGVFFAANANGAGSETGLIAAQSAQNAINGQWTAELKSGNPQKIYVMFQKRHKENGIRNESLTLSSSDLSGLSPENLTIAKTLVVFRIVRESGTFEFEGYFSEGKGAGFWTLIPNQSFISAMRSRGYNSLTENDLFSAAIGNVSIKQMEDLKSFGYDRLSFEQLFLAGAFNVAPDFISAWRLAGFNNLSFGELLQLGMFKVTPEFLDEIKAEGFPQLSLSTAVNLKIHNIDRDFIRRARAGGFPNVTLGELIHLRIRSKVK